MPQSLGSFGPSRTGQSSATLGFEAESLRDALAPVSEKHRFAWHMHWYYKRCCGQECRRYTVDQELQRSEKARWKCGLAAARKLRAPAFDPRCGWSPTQPRSVVHGKGVARLLQQTGLVLLYH